MILHQVHLVFGEKGIDPNTGEINTQRTKSKTADYRIFIVYIVYKHTFGQWAYQSKEEGRQISRVNYYLTLIEEMLCVLCHKKFIKYPQTSTKFPSTIIKSSVAQVNFFHFAIS